MSAFTSLTWEALLHRQPVLPGPGRHPGQRVAVDPRDVPDRSQLLAHRPGRERRRPHAAPAQLRAGAVRAVQGVRGDQHAGVVPQVEPALRARTPSSSCRATSSRTRPTPWACPATRRPSSAAGRNDREIEYFSNDPRLDGEARHGWFIRSATGTLLLHSLTDSIRLGRFVTMNAGLGLTNTISETNAGKGGLNLHAFTPHVSSIWDVTQDGRTVLRGSFAQLRRRRRGPHLAATPWATRCRASAAGTRRPRLRPSAANTGAAPARPPSACPAAPRAHRPTARAARRS